MLRNVRTAAAGAFACAKGSFECSRIRDTLRFSERLSLLKSPPRDAVRTFRRRATRAAAGAFACATGSFESPPRDAVRTFRTVVALAFLLLFGLGGVGAEPLTLQGAVDRALAQNVGYQSSLLAVDQARNSLIDPVNWKGIGVSATQKQSSDVKAASTTTLGLNLPLFDQLGASATVDQDKNTQVSVTATPLVHTDTAAQATIAYDKAILGAVQARVTLEAAVRKAYLAQVSAQAQRDVQVATTALKQTAYHDAKTRLDKGTVTLTEVRAALKDWTDAQSQQTTLEKALVQAKAALAAQLQTETADLAPLDAATVEAAVAALGAVDPVVKGTSTAVKVQSLEVDSRKAKAEAVWWLDPGLSLTGTGVLPATGTATWSGSVTLSLSLGSWQGSDRSLADRSLDLARQTLAAQSVAARSAEAQALLTIQAAASALESRKLALAQATDLLEETQLLAKAGKATELDLEEAQLGVKAAENDVFQAWADVYGARLDLVVARS